MSKKSTDTPSAKRQLTVRKRRPSARIGVIDLGERVALRQLGVLDSIGVPAVLLTRTHRVVKYTDAFRKLLGDGLILRRSALAATDAASNAALRRMVRNVRPEDTEVVSSDLPAVAATRRGTRPLVITVLAVQGNAQPADCKMILLITDPDHRHQPDEAILRAMFGLTPSEAQFAQSLTVGGFAARDRQALASGNRADEHLRAILRKTKLRRRSELLRTLIRLGGPFKKRKD